MPTFHYILSILLTVLLATSVNADEQASVDDEFFRNMVATRYVAPFGAGDIDAWISAFDTQALALHNRRPADRGIKAIESFGRMVHQYFDLREYTVEVTDIRRSDNWVYTAGVYTTRFVSKEDGTEPFGRESGKFLLLWERQDDGQWKIIVDTGNSNQ